LDSVLFKDNFIIKISEWETAAEQKASEVTGILKSRGTLHSKAFTDGKASEITLAGLRKKLSVVSSM
jgi:hypothetical protein